MNFEILYSDADIAVIKKPAGIISEGQKDDGKSAPWLISSALTERGITVREVLTVHRLDQKTQGLMVFALSARAAAALSRDIAEQKLQKTYTATVHGRPELDEGELRDLLFFDRKRGKSFVVDRERKGVKEALLKYRLLKYDQAANTSKLEIELLTGRTHQIRVQFASRGMYLVGDRRYGAPAGNFDLTSKRIEFPHPKTGEIMTFEISE